MRNSNLRWLRSRLAACLYCVISIEPATASNAFNVIGYSGESEIMGGADVAIARDVSALATNPAGMTQLVGRELDVFASPYYLLDLSHRDSVGNDLHSMPKFGVLGGGGYLQRLNPRLVAGIGLFVQGGSGFAYEDFNSGFGARGDLSALFGIFKLAPGAAWTVNDQLSIGAALNLVYATARQKTFPNASISNSENPAASFYGSRIDGLKAFGTGFKLGLQYRPQPAWTLGLSFGSRTPLDLKNGEMTVNYQALGQGRVVYGDARIDGLATAQDVSLGIAYRPPRWLISAEVSWLDWSNAIGDITTSVGAPRGNVDTGSLPAIAPTVASLDYRDQWVFALGASYEWDDKTRVRGGFNYGRQPTPDQNLNPLFAVIAQHHFTLGIARDLNPHWELGLGLQLQGPRNEHYSNPSAPFTVNAVETNSALWLSTSLIRRW